MGDLLIEAQQRLNHISDVTQQRKFEIRQVSLSTPQGTGKDRNRASQLESCGVSQTESHKALSLFLLGRQCTQPPEARLNPLTKLLLQLCSEVHTFLFLSFSLNEHTVARDETEKSAVH